MLFIYNNVNKICAFSNYYWQNKKAKNFIIKEERRENMEVGNNGVKKEK